MDSSTMLLIELGADVMMMIFLWLILDRLTEIANIMRVRDMARSDR